MPSQNSAGFSGANPIQHFGKNLSPRFFGSLRLAERGDDFKFFFGGKFFQFRKLRFKRHHLSFCTFRRFPCVDKVFHKDLEKPAFGLTEFKTA
ncbi:MAG: hypothetical protein A3A17_01530 [Candidatus Ryanbacteria bacterium RIFCSPLOWO2_01_FULL_44_230]|nr:MAG: hypothetical protein A3A17_01530 [Candidatus Ryanbacteria bacterium RIFCSPLOWO2_01_FULL_44_230]